MSNINEINEPSINESFVQDSEPPNWRSLLAGSGSSAPAREAFDLRHDRLLPRELGLQAWSDRQDLVALVDIRGRRLRVQRLNWKRWMTLDIPSGGLPGTSASAASAEDDHAEHDENSHPSSAATPKAATRSKLSLSDDEGEEEEEEDELVRASAIAWSSDGRMVALGQADGSLRCVGLEQKTVVWSRRAFAHRPVTSGSLSNNSEDDESDEDDDVFAGDEDNANTATDHQVQALQWLKTVPVQPPLELPGVDQFFPPLADVIGASLEDPLAQPGAQQSRSDDNQRFSLALAMAAETSQSSPGDARSPEILIAGSRDGRIELSAASGTLPLLRVDLNPAPGKAQSLPVPPPSQPSPLRLEAVAAAPDLSSICCLVRTRAPQQLQLPFPPPGGFAQIVCWATPRLARLRGFLAALAELGGDIRGHLRYLERAVAAVGDRWEQLLKKVNRKMSFLQDVLDEEESESTPAWEWRQLIVTGSPTPEMHRFLGYFAEAALREQHRFCRHTFVGMIQALETNLLPAAQRLVFLLSNLRTLLDAMQQEIVSDGKSCNRNVQDNDVNSPAQRTHRRLAWDCDSMLRSAQAFLERVQALCLQILRSRLCCEHFFNWLTSLIHNANLNPDDLAEGLVTPLPFQQDLSPNMVLEFLELDLPKQGSRINQCIIAASTPTGPAALKNINKGTNTPLHNQTPVATTLRGQLISLERSWARGEAQLVRTVSSWCIGDPRHAPQVRLPLFPVNSGGRPVVPRVFGGAPQLRWASGRYFAAVAWADANARGELRETTFLSVASFDPHLPPPRRSSKSASSPAPSSSAQEQRHHKHPDVHSRDIQKGSRRSSVTKSPNSIRRRLALLSHTSRLFSPSADSGNSFRVRDLRFFDSARISVLVELSQVVPSSPSPSSSSSSSSTGHGSDSDEEDVDDDDNENVKLSSYLFQLPYGPSAIPFAVPAGGDGFLMEHSHHHQTHPNQDHQQPGTPYSSLDFSLFQLPAPATADTSTDGWACRESVAGRLLAANKGCLRLAVSGARRVASVLLGDRRRLQVLDLDDDGEDEDGEEEEEQDEEEEEEDDGENSIEDEEE